MNTDFLDIIDRRIRALTIPGGALTNVAQHLRSCGCTLLTLHFEGLLMENWNSRGNEVLDLVNAERYPWNVVYLNTFPGTDIINRITFRKLCPHCLENYRLDGVMGMGSVVFSERIDPAASSGGLA